MKTVVLATDCGYTQRWIARCFGVVDAAADIVVLDLRKLADTNLCRFHPDLTYVDTTHWEITHAGLARMETCWKLKQPTPMLSPRLLPHQDATVFELLCALDRACWTFQMLCKGARGVVRDPEGQAPASPNVVRDFIIGDNKVAYVRTGSTNISHGYLVALLTRCFMANPTSTIGF